MNSKFTEEVLSNFDLFKFVLTGVGIIGVILLIYGSVDTPQPIYHYQLDDLHTVDTGCTTNNVFRGLLLGTLGLLICTGTYLTILVRNVPSLFNEGSYIGITIYNALVLGVIGIVLDVVLSEDAHGQIVVRCFLLIIGTFVVIGALYCTKIYQLYVAWSIHRESVASSEDLRKLLAKKLYRQAIQEGKTPGYAKTWADAAANRRLAINEVAKANFTGSVLSSQGEMTALHGNLTRWDSHGGHVTAPATPQTPHRVIPNLHLTGVPLPFPATRPCPTSGRTLSQKKGHRSSALASQPPSAPPSPLPPIRTKLEQEAPDTITVPSHLPSHTISIQGDPYLAASVETLAPNVPHLALPASTTATPRSASSVMPHCIRVHFNMSSNATTGELVQLVQKMARSHQEPTQSAPSTCNPKSAASLMRST